MLSGVRQHGLRCLVWSNDSPSLYYKFTYHRPSGARRCRLARVLQGSTAGKTRKATFSGRTITPIYTSLISGTTRGRGEDSHIVAGIMGVCLGWN